MGVFGVICFNFAICLKVIKVYSWKKSFFFPSPKVSNLSYWHYRKRFVLYLDEDRILLTPVHQQEENLAQERTAVPEWKKTVRVKRLPGTQEYQE